MFHKRLKQEIADKNNQIEALEKKLIEQNAGRDVFNPLYSIQKKKIKIQLFPDKKKHWRFRILANNNKILCSSEAYSRKCFATQAADLIRSSRLVVVEK